MCGISGVISGSISLSRQADIVTNMNSRMRHRGPDNSGLWNGENVCLGHTRLSIIDLGSQSNQPFSGDDKRFIIVYNGELYNYKELKLELQRSSQGSGDKPYFFRTSSDTEVVLAAYTRWGARCLDYFNGMFAFGIYDKETKKLFMARDRMGVKPLYYYHENDTLVFASEVRAIIHSGIRKFELNRSALGEFVMYQTVHAPDTIVEEIQMLMPGCYAEHSGSNLSVSKYFDIHERNLAGIERNYKEICENVAELLATSVQRRMIADVPFGAFLSGGIDSSAVVGLMSKVSTAKINTFNVSFGKSEFSESIYARQIAKRFNTKHHEIELSANDFLKLLPEALNAMDHPSGDGPNTYVVSKATKEAGITMALSGIGSDELFAGYPVFKRLYRLKNAWWLQASPVAARKMAALTIRMMKKNVAGGKMAELLGGKKISFETAYLLSRSLFTSAEFKKLLPLAEPHSGIGDLVRAVPQTENHLLSAVSIAEITTYLQNVLLRDTDQMSMAVALEVREPFLDHRLVEFVLNLEDEYKYPHTPKKLLTDSLAGLLPDDIINRQKMGFTFPWEKWLKNELKDFVEMNIHQLSTHEQFDEKNLKGLWNRFLNGDKKTSWSRIWHLAILNHWIRNNGFA